MFLRPFWLSFKQFFLFFLSYFFHPIFFTPIFIFLSVSMGSKIAQADCPDWIQDEKKVPLCPKDNGFLGDEFPAIAHVLGSGEVGRTSVGRLMETVRSLLTASKEKTPLIFLNVSEEVFDQVQKGIEGEFVPKKYTESLKRMSVKNLDWAQDRFQFFADSRAGKIVLRQTRDRNSTSKKDNESSVEDGLKQIEKECPQIQVGPVLRHFSGKENWYSEYGGNIEFTPFAGLCIRGSDQSRSFANQFCTKENEIVVPTDWLHVGHVDEYISTHPVPNSKSGCDVVLQIASFEKAKQILKKHVSEKLFENALFDLDFKKEKGRKEEGKEDEKRDLKQEGFAEMILWNYPGFCEFFKKKQNKEANAKKIEAPPNVPKGHKDVEKKRPSEVEVKKCHEAQILDFLEYIHFQQVDENKDKQGSIADRNEVIQRKLNLIAKEIQEKIETKLAKTGKACKVHTIESPQIFHEGHSFFPNPTNGIYVEGTYLAPYPMNAVLKKYLEEQFKTYGIATRFIGTFDLHINQGNLHCATNTIRYCRANPHASTTIIDPLTLPIEDGTSIPKFLTKKDLPLIQRFLKEGNDKVQIKLLEQIKENREVWKDAESTKEMLAIVLECLKESSNEIVVDALVRTLVAFDYSFNKMETLFHEGTQAQQNAILKNLRFVASEKRKAYEKLVRKGLSSSDPRQISIALSVRHFVEVLSKEIIAFLEHKSAEVRKAALRSLREVNGQTLEIKKVETLRQDADSGVRLEALEYTKEHLQKKTEFLKNTIEMALEDKDELVRSRAHYIAGETGFKLDVLKKGLGDNSMEVRKQAILGFVQSPNKTISVESAKLLFMKSNKEVTQEIKEAVALFFVKKEKTKENEKLFQETTQEGRTLMMKQSLLASTGKALWPIELGFSSSDDKALADEAFRLLTSTKGILADFYIHREYQAAFRQAAERAGRSKEDIERLVRMYTREP